MINRLLVFLLILPLTFTIINAHAATNTYYLKDPTGKTYKITYTINGGELSNITIDRDFASILVDVKASNGGVLEIQFPRELVDDYANIGEFIVALDNGKEIDYEEMSETCDTRTLQIQFPAGTKQIALISPYPPTSGGPGGQPFPREVGSIAFSFNEEIFTLNTNSTSKICTWNFSPSERKLEFVVSGDILVLNQTTHLVSLANSTSKYFQVSIPSRLLDGNFTVFMDGNKTNFKQGKNDGNNEISIDYHKSDVPRKIEIVGTSIIPEFPVNLMLVTAVGLIGALVAVRLKAKDITRVK